MGLIILFVVIFGGIGLTAFFVYRRSLRKAKAVERGLKMVPILIKLPPRSADTASEGRDIREVAREKISQAEVLYDIIAGTAAKGFKSNFYGQRHIAFEIIAAGGEIKFFAAVPIAMVSVVEKSILTAYPGAQLEKTEDHNLFNPTGKLAGTVGGELALKSDKAYPIATYKELERDPMEALLNILSDLKAGDGVGVQIMLRPAAPNWTKKGEKLVHELRQNRQSGLKFTAKDLVKAAVRAPEPSKEQGHDVQLSNLELSRIEAIEEKLKHPGFEVLIRVMASSDIPAQAQAILRDLTAAFAVFNSQGLNGFEFIPGRDMQGLVTAFIFRFFPPELTSTVLNTRELATIFHLPDSKFTPTAEVARQPARQVDAPVAMAKQGMLLGYNQFRGERKEVRLAPEDRRRHVYIVGQTGTGKSTMLETLAVQDMLSGSGFAFIDPHGDAAEKLLSMVPKNRAEDVIYFNPGDIEHPLGLNLFEFSSPEQKDFIIQETINMLYRLYDPGHTGIIGPRYEHWFRNAALTLMADPEGSTFIEIPKLFTDTDFLKAKFRHVTDPTVIDFWTKEMAQTSDYHKSEVLGWFVSKFGAFMTNEMMRNIIGQKQSSFNLREIMDGRKILIVNLSKGRVGELNSQLLGMILVTKIQAAAMSRANIPEETRTDFALYVDEFQNFSTDSFATILSEARKYRLSLIVANQFIGQLTPEIKNAVFGNVGTIVSFRSGPEDADYLAKQFAPAFDQQDVAGLPNFQAVARLMVGGLPSQPFSMLSLPPLKVSNHEIGEAIRDLSSAKFGRPRAQVEADILRRMGPVGKAGKDVQPAKPAAPPPEQSRSSTPQPAPAPPPPAPAAQPAPSAESEEKPLFPTAKHEEIASQTEADSTDGGTLDFKDMVPAGAEIKQTPSAQPMPTKQVPSVPPAPQAKTQPPAQEKPRPAEAEPAPPAKDVGDAGPTPPSETPSAAKEPPVPPDPIPPSPDTDQAPVTIPGVSDFLGEDNDGEAVESVPEPAPQLPGSIIRPQQAETEEIAGVRIIQQGRPRLGEQAGDSVAAPAQNPPGKAESAAPPKQEKIPAKPIPKLAPGEVYVDEDGKVYKG